MMAGRGEGVGKEDRKKQLDVLAENQESVV